MNCKIIALLLILFLLCIPKAKAQKTDAEILLKEGIQDYNELEFKRAIQSLESALDLGLPDKSKVSAYKYLGFAYIVQEDIPKAKDTFKKLLEIQPDYQLSPEISPKLSQVFNEAKSEFKPKVKIVKKTGDIFIESEPSQAEIYLDELLQKSKTPTTIESVISGIHSMRLSKSGYQEWKQKINVEAGKTSRLSVNLIPIPERTQPKSQQLPKRKKGSNLKWYLLGGTVAAIGGGVGAFLLTRDSGDSDDRLKTKSLTISISVP